MTNLVKKLRDAEETIPLEPYEKYLHALCVEAADRIESLEAALDEIAKAAAGFPHLSRLALEPFKEKDDE